MLLLHVQTETTCIPFVYNKNKLKKKNSVYCCIFQIQLDQIVVCGCKCSPVGKAFPYGSCARKDTNQHMYNQLSPESNKKELWVCQGFEVLASGVRVCNDGCLQNELASTTSCICKVCWTWRHAIEFGGRCWWLKTFRMSLQGSRFSSPTAFCVWCQQNVLAHSLWIFILEALFIALSAWCIFQSAFMPYDAVFPMPSAGYYIIHWLVVSILLGLLRGLVWIFHRALWQAGTKLANRKCCQIWVGLSGMEWVQRCPLTQTLGARFFDADTIYSGNAIIYIWSENQTF